MKRRVFYSFHHELDSWRAAQVRNIGVVEGNQPTTDNDWEEIKRGGDQAIKNWIDTQLKGRTCTIVLVGAKTAERKWVKYEINKSWSLRMGVVGIYIHGLKDKYGYTTHKGQNPFYSVTVPIHGNEVRLSSIVKCYNPSGNNSLERYDWIKRNLSAAVEEAIQIRSQY